MPRVPGVLVFGLQALKLFGLDTTTVEIAVGQIKGYLTPTPEERAASFELFIELSSRTATVTLADEHRLLRSALDNMGVVATAGGLVAGGESVRASRDGTTRVEVVSALEADGGNAYTARPVDAPEGAPATVEFRSDRHLRLGEAVYVTTGSSGVRLAGPLDDGWIPVSIVLILLGLGVLTFGVRLRNWVVRCRRLALLA